MYYLMQIFLDAADEEVMPRLMKRSDLCTALSATKMWKEGSATAQTPSAVLNAGELIRGKATFNSADSLAAAGVDPSAAAKIAAV